MARLYGPGPGEPPALIVTQDLAGLSTSDVEGAPVGELVGALSEKRTGLIRYLDVSVRAAARHVLIPIGHTRIERASTPPRVRLRAASHDDLLSVPEFEEDTALDAGYHERVMSVHGRLFYGSRYYAHPAYDHRALRIGDSPVIEVEEEAGETGLRPASELDGRVARRLRSLIGLPVTDRDGERVGRIGDFIIETPVRRERYAVLDLEDPERSAVVPVGYVEVDPDSERATTPALSGEDIRLLPAYEPPLSREEENRIHAAIEGRLAGERYFERADFRPSVEPTG